MWPLRGLNHFRNGARTRLSRLSVVGPTAFVYMLGFVANGWAGSVSAQEQSTATLHGVVLESPGDRPVAEVRVSLSPTGMSVTTTAAGRFSLERIPFGRYELRFERLGYVTRVDSMSVGPGRPMDITVRLSTNPVPLEPIEAVARSASLERAGFYERRALGANGTFFTRADIERFAPVVLSDLVRRAPVTMIQYGGPGRTELFFRRQVGMSSMGCKPALFLDGFLIREDGDFERVTPSEVEAVELYVGANVPLEFKLNSCGSVLIWTRRGE